MLAIGRPMGIALAFLIGVVAALAQDVPEQKRTKLGLYLTAAEAAGALAEPGATCSESSGLSPPTDAGCHIINQDDKLTSTFTTNAISLDLLTKPEDGGIDLKKIAPKARVY